MLVDPGDELAPPQARRSRCWRRVVRGAGCLCRRALRPSAICYEAERYGRGFGFCHAAASAFSCRRCWHRSGKTLGICDETAPHRRRAARARKAMDSSTPSNIDLAGCELCGTVRAQRHGLLIAASTAPPGGRRIRPVLALTARAAGTLVAPQQRPSGPSSTAADRHKPPAPLPGPDPDAPALLGRAGLRHSAALRHGGGAGTFHPATTLRALGPEAWRAAYVQPSRRPTDGRYGENPNRLQHYYQFQVILKPSPPDIQDLYLDSL